MSSWTIPSESSFHQFTSRRHQRGPADNTPSASRATPSSADSTRNKNAPAMKFSPGIKAPPQVGSQRSRRQGPGSRQEQGKGKPGAGGTFVRNARLAQRSRTADTNQAFGSARGVLVGDPVRIVDGTQGRPVADQVYDLSMTLGGLRLRVERSAEVLRSVAQGFLELEQAFEPLFAALEAGMARCNQADVEAVFGRPLSALSTTRPLSEATSLGDRGGGGRGGVEKVTTETATRVGKLAAEISALSRDVQAAECLAQQGSRLRTIARWTRLAKRPVRGAAKPSDSGYQRVGLEGAGPKRDGLIQATTDGSRVKRADDGLVACGEWAVRIFRPCNDISDCGKDKGMASQTSSNGSSSSSSSSSGSSSRSRNDGSGDYNGRYCPIVVVQPLCIALPAPSPPRPPPPPVSETPARLAATRFSGGWRRPLSWLLGSRNSANNESRRGDHDAPNSRSATTQRSDSPSAVTAHESRDNPLPHVIVRVLFCGRPTDLAALATVAVPGTSSGTITGTCSTKNSEPTIAPERGEGRLGSSCADCDSHRGVSCADMGGRNGDGVGSAGKRLLPSGSEGKTGFEGRTVQGPGEAAAEGGSSVLLLGRTEGRYTGAAVELVKSEVRVVEAVSPTDGLDSRPVDEQCPYTARGDPSFVSRPVLQLQIVLQLRTSVPVAVTRLVHRGGHVVQNAPMSRKSRQSAKSSTRPSPSPINSSSSSRGLDCSVRVSSQCPVSKHCGTSNRFITSNRYVTVAAPISNVKERQSHGTEAGGGDHSDDKSATASKYEEECDHDPGVDDLPSQWGELPAELALPFGGGCSTGGTAFDKADLGTNHLLGLTVVIPPQHVLGSSGNDLNQAKAQETRMAGQSMDQMEFTAEEPSATSRFRSCAARSSSKKRPRTLNTDEVQQDGEGHEQAVKLEHGHFGRTLAEQQLYSKSTDAFSGDDPTGNSNCMFKCTPQSPGNDGRERAKRRRQGPSVSTPRGGTASAEGGGGGRWTWGFPWFSRAGQTEQQTQAPATAIASPVSSIAASPMPSPETLRFSPGERPSGAHWGPGSGFERTREQSTVMDERDGRWGENGSEVVDCDRLESSGDDHENMLREAGDGGSGRPSVRPVERKRRQMTLRSPVVVTVVLSPPAAGDETLG